MLELLQHPDIKAIQASLREQLRQTEIGRTRDGGATADRAVDCLTASMLFHIVPEYQPTPYFVWGTEDSRRDWRGRSVPCIGTAGDNPDNIYRSTTLEGGVRYEITGRLDPRRRATQFILQMGRAKAASRPTWRPPGRSGPGARRFRRPAHAHRARRQFSPDRRRRKRRAGPYCDPARTDLDRLSRLHGGLEPGTGADRRPPARSGRGHGPTNDEIRRIAVGRLGDYVRNWSQYATYGFGGLKPNTHSQPNGRAGGWGFVWGRLPAGPG